MTDSFLELARRSGFGGWPVSARSVLQRYNTTSLRAAFDALEAELHCGVEDDPEWLRSPGINPLSYGLADRLWSRGNLTFTLNPAGSGLPAASVINVINNVLTQWANASLGFFTFTPAPLGATPDLQIRFGDTSLSSKFGRPGGVAASAGRPPSGAISFDSAESWATPSVPGAPPLQPGQVDLLPPALHEVGHALGLTHSTEQTSVMYPFDMRLTVLDAESIQAIRNMYGWRPQTALNEFSSDGPALAVGNRRTFTSTNSTLFMAWKGMGADQAIHIAEFDGTTFRRPERHDDFRSSHGPALASYTRAGAAAFVTGLFMAWKGEGEDEGVYFSENPELQGWRAFRRVEGVFSNARPALAQLGSDMIMAWKGMGEDQGIYWSRYDGSTWSPLQNLRGQGTSHAPTLAAAGNRVYLFWKAMGEDQRIFYSWLDDGPAAIWAPGQAVTYIHSETEGMVQKNVFTDHHVAAAARINNTVILAWKGVRGDSGISFSQLQNDEWSGEIRIPGVGFPGIGSSTGPALAEFDSRLFMAWKGSLGNERISFTSLG